MNRRKLFKYVGLPALMALGGTAGYRAVKPGENPYYQGPKSDHFDGLRFFNPGRFTDRGFAELMRWQFGGGREPWPESYPSPFHDRPPAEVEGLRVTLVGHATYLVQTARANILIDPVWAERASPVTFAGPKRVNPPGIAFADLPRIHAVLVTHNHYDHLDTATIARLWDRDRPRIVAPLGNDAIIRGHDPDIRVETLDWGGEARLTDAVSTVLEPAYHWSSRWMSDRRMALWGAFVLKAPAGVVYAVGDTGYGDGRIFEAVRERHGPPRLALLPIGAYEPRWFMEPQHMNPADAVKAYLACGAEAALGHHWGTFRLTNEGVDRPAHDLSVALDEAGISRERFRAMRPGEVFDADAA